MPESCAVQQEHNIFSSSYTYVCAHNLYSCCKLLWPQSYFFYNYSILAISVTNSMHWWIYAFIYACIALFYQLNFKSQFIWNKTTPCRMFPLKFRQLWVCKIVAFHIIFPYNLWSNELKTCTNWNFEKKKYISGVPNQKRYVLLFNLQHPLKYTCYKFAAIK